VNIPDAQHAKYLEQHCPGYLWSAFVTTSGHDQQLMQEMVQKHRCTVRPPLLFAVVVCRALSAPLAALN
jgi:hypothetical protein